MRDDQRHIPLRIRMDEPRRYAKGGLAAHAEKVRGAGRYGDDMIVHINKDEFNQLRQAWGEPTINPKTGAPEYFLSGLRKWFQENPVASAVLPAATSILLPGLGAAVGNAVNFGGVLGGASGMVGNGLVGAGIGALTGGTQGALIGGATGAIAPMIADGLGNMFGTPGGTSAGGVRDSSIATTNGVTGGNSGGSGSGSSGGWGGALSSLGKNPESLLKAALGLGTIASAFYRPKDQAVQQGQANNAAAQEQFNRPLPQVDFNRQRVAMQGDPRRYGTQGGQQFFANNQLPTVAAARGGKIEHPAPQGALSQASRYVAGAGTGRSDEIPALLSDGEYVIDSEIVAMLGDGSSKAGAQRLDAFREEVRKHKGAHLAKGKISPDAKPPMAYLKKVK